MGSANYKGFDLAQNQQAWIDASTAYEDELRAQGASPHYETGHYNFMIDFKRYVEHQNLTLPLRAGRQRRLRGEAYRVPR